MGILLGGHLKKAPAPDPSAFPVTYVAADIGDPGGICLNATYWDTASGPSGASATCRIWVETSASDTFVRIDITNKSGNDQNPDWYNTAGVAQGDPGSNQNALQLGERIDTVKIRLVASDEADDGVTVSQQGSFTDDVAFNPTNAVQYGYNIECDSGVPPGVFDSDDGYITIEFTFVKSGFTTLMVTYRANIDTEANDDS